MNIVSDTARDRIFAAADELYAETGKNSFPSVDAVRKKARVNMNDACTGMKDWRRAQTTTTKAVSTQLPAELQARGSNLLSGFWDEATKLANDSLLAAQAGWEVERQESEELSRQMAAAYDAQSSEIASADHENSRLKEQVLLLNDEIHSLQQKLSQMSAERDRTQHEISEITALTFELRKRVDDAREAEDRAREDATRARAETADLRSSHADQIERLRAEFKRELDGERDRTERERQRYEEVATKATTEAARLRGKLEALNIPPADKRVRAESSGNKRKPNGGAGGRAG